MEPVDQMSFRRFLLYYAYSTVIFNSIREVAIMLHHWYVNSGAQ
jgi:hypothetical protein